MSSLPSPRCPVGCATHVGRVREHNEDALLAAGSVYAVCDGMGGHAAGEVASGIVVRTLSALAERSSVTADDLVHALADAHEQLIASAREFPEQAGMGTTAVVLAVDESRGEPHWVLANIGDSRAYRWYDGEVQQVTTDHSEVQELVDAGYLTPEQAERHPMRNIITRSVGMEPAAEADLWSMPVTPGERILLCSDGLTGELSDPAIAEILDSHPDPQVAADALVRAACDAGGRDNVAVVVVESPQA